MMAEDPLLESWKRNHDASVASGAVAVKTALLINGGAAAALLTFIGGIASQGRISVGDIKNIANGLSWFGYGVLSAAIANAIAYLANRAILHTVGKESRFWNVISLIVQLSAAAVVVSLILFVYGFLHIRTAIGHLQFIDPAKSSYNVQGHEFHGGLRRVARA
jgi:hypothetical protein